MTGYHFLSGFRLFKAVYLLLIICTINACDPIDYKLKIYNLSESSLFCIHSFSSEIQLIDSTVAEPYSGKGFPIGAHYIVRANYIKWENQINRHSIDKKLRIYIFHEDSVNKYSWKQLIEEKKYNKKYELSVSDLEKNNWIVTYP
jgi:hypothetical protein